MGIWESVFKNVEWVENMSYNVFKDRITVYHFAGDTIEKYSFGDEVPVGIHEGFAVRASE